mmetsp:Transcript_14494/g.45564  ORF Transcript_14494/g.45564 Transcript_14494/m.45564 type:complete len:281 (+) Transcript_14494:207-1049(+)
MARPVQADSVSDRSAVRWLREAPSAAVARPSKAALPSVSDRNVPPRTDEAVRAASSAVVVDFDRPVVCSEREVRRRCGDDKQSWRWTKLALARLRSLNDREVSDSGPREGGRWASRAAKHRKKVATPLSLCFGRASSSGKTDGTSASVGSASRSHRGTSERRTPPACGSRPTPGPPRSGSSSEKTPPFTAVGRGMTLCAWAAMCNASSDGGAGGTKWSHGAKQGCSLPQRRATRAPGNDGSTLSDGARIDSVDGDRLTRATSSVASAADADDGGNKVEQL